VALRSGYEGGPTERPAFQPSAREIVDVAVTHLGAGGGRISFGRACDGEPLARVRVIEEAADGIRRRVPGATVHLETAGTDPTALRRAIGSGVNSVTVRLGSAVSATYDRLHGPASHRWSDVRASLDAAADLRVRLTVALLMLPGLTDRASETEAIAELLDALPGGTLELRDLGCDPIRTLAAFPRAPAAGMRALLGRLAAVEHFRVP
jgi:pyruvate-formate lyase-activating enzyme